VRFLDFVKVREAERKRALELFGSGEEDMTDLAREIVGKRSAGGPSVGRRGEENGGGGGGRVKLSGKERKRVEAMIRNAKSLVEIERLERELNEGRIPGGVVDDDDEDESEDEDEDMEE